MTAAGKSNEMVQHSVIVCYFALFLSLVRIGAMAALYFGLLVPSGTIIKGNAIGLPVVLLLAAYALWLAHRAAERLLLWLLICTQIADFVMLVFLNQIGRWPILAISMGWLMVALVAAQQLRTQSTKD